jgi:hypothetical protein
MNSARANALLRPPAWPLGQRRRPSGTVRRARETAPGERMRERLSACGLGTHLARQTLACRRSCSSRHNPVADVMSCNQAGQHVLPEGKAGGEAWFRGTGCSDRLRRPDGPPLARQSAGRHQQPRPCCICLRRFPEDFCRRGVQPSGAHLRLAVDALAAAGQALGVGLVLVLVHPRQGLLRRLHHVFESFEDAGPRVPPTPLLLLGERRGAWLSFL